MGILKKADEFLGRKKEEAVDRIKTGRTTIDDSRRTSSHSKRAKESIISVEKSNHPLCPFCGHHKLFHKPSGTQCCRCKKWLRRFGEKYI